MLVLLVLAALPLIGIYLYNKAYHKRFVQFASIPQLPSSLVWGHLQIFDAYIKRGPRDRHPGKSPDFCNQSNAMLTWLQTWSLPRCSRPWESHH